MIENQIRPSVSRPGEIFNPSLLLLKRLSLPRIVSPDLLASKHPIHSPFFRDPGVFALQKTPHNPLVGMHASHVRDVCPLDASEDGVAIDNVAAETCANMQPPNHPSVHPSLPPSICVNG